MPDIGIFFVGEIFFNNHIVFLNYMLLVLLSDCDDIRAEVPLPKIRPALSKSL
jgi:hypothetical protein